MKTPAKTPERIPLNWLALAEDDCGGVMITRMRRAEDNSEFEVLASIYVQKEDRQQMADYLLPYK